MENAISAKHYLVEVREDSQSIIVTIAEKFEDSSVAVAIQHFKSSGMTLQDCNEQASMFAEELAGLFQKYFSKEEKENEEENGKQLDLPLNNP